jgi:hypothetical protein
MLMMMLPGTSIDLMAAARRAADMPPEAADREFAAAWRKHEFIVARFELVYAALFGASPYGFFRLKSPRHAKCI